MCVVGPNRCLKGNRGPAPAGLRCGQTRRETSMEIDMPTKGMLLAETRGSRLFFASLLEASLATANSRHVSCEQRLLAAITANNGADAVEADKDSMRTTVKQFVDHRGSS